MTQVSLLAYARRRWKRLSLDDFLELASRVGFIARGAVYVSLGAIALLAALDLAPEAEGPAEAVEAWAEWPAGSFLIVAAAFGLLGFALWRGLQSVFDADRRGTSPKAIAIRVGEAMSGVVHAALGFSIFATLEFVDEAMESSGGNGALSGLFEAPLGEGLLLAAGLFTIGVGIGNAVQAIFRDFSKRLGCDPQTCRWAVWLGRAGYMGRAVAFVPLGFLMVQAGLDRRSEESASFGAALQSLEAQSFGTLALSLTAIGLISFGAFAIFEAFYRRIDVDVEN